MHCMHQKNYKIVLGIDEAGRGPLAGPVIAAAVSFSNNKNCINLLRSQQIDTGWISGLKDSKKLTAKRRGKVYGFLKRHPYVKWGIGNVSEKVIDKINILQATKLAMVRAVKNLTKKLEKTSVSTKAKRNFTPSLNSCDRINKEIMNFRPCLLLIDGNFGVDLPYPQKSIIKGDERVFLIKLASIVAKVHRDRLMLSYHKRYPQYGFDKHKGYGTKLHLAALAKHGCCAIHRKSFKPVSKIFNFQ